MAPISTDLVGWAVTEQPEAAFLSIVILLIVSIALLVLCASCKKKSFELDGSSAPEQKASTLVSVARMDNSSGARQNPAANDITDDEMGLEAGTGDVVYRPWRSHTLTHDSSPPTQINGGVGTKTEGSVTL